MIGDFEKLLNKGETLTMHVLGRPFEVKVKDVSIELFEWQYLIQFSDNPSDAKWVNNMIIRQFQFQN